MSKLFILQSGFVTHEASQLTKVDEIDLTFNDSLYQGRSAADTENYYDEGVEKLFQQWHKDNTLMNRFEFRELILENAFRVFKSKQKSIEPWIRLQMPQRTVGYLHRKFLKDSLRFILDGVPMSMDNYSYYRLLSAQNGSHHLQHGDDRSNEELQNYIAKNHSTELTYVLSNWTRDIKGFNDLLMSIHVIFGRRRGQVSVPRNMQ